MTREEIMNSIALKKRFCKDCSLPIAIFDNPYFHERLQTLDVLYDCVHKFDAFCDELQSFANEQEYFEHYNKVKDSMVEFIKGKSEYNSFINSSFPVEPIVSRKELYIDDNDDRAFISIDMKKANFSALNHFSHEIFDNAESWEQFVSKFTDCQHIINSKYVRQVVLGSCNPKKQITYERYLMNILCIHIMDNIPNASIYSLGEDEILINVPREYGVGCGFSLSDLKKTVESCPDDIGKLVRVEMFEFFKIKGTDGFIKIYDDFDREEFKCLNSEIFHQVVKHFYGKKITDNDLVFYHNGRLAKFVEGIDNPWS